MRIRISKELIPWGMAAGRAALGPILIAGAACSWNGVTLAGIVVTALVSDIYDGVLARRWGCDTAGVRLFDSMADTVFYLCTGVALWIGQPQVWRSYGGLLVALLGLEVVRFAFDLVKFGKPASYHSYLAKLWGLVMAIAVVGVFAMHRSNVLVPAALVLGILCDLEGLAMSVVMPVWRKDIKTLRAALNFRRQRVESGALWRFRSRRRSFGKGRNLAIGGSFVVGLVFALGLVLATPAFAVEAGQVAYTGGSLSVAPGTIGSFDLTSSTALAFKYAGPGASANEVAIEYKNIRGYSYTSEVAYHLGVLPAIAVGLLKSRERRHFLTIRYVDSADVAQAAVFEVAKSDPTALLAVLRARAPQACGSPMLNCGRGQVRPGGDVAPGQQGATPAPRF
jgi:CDP-diacylglycerol--glycerol-3-phosphate 3-phosphatidyltransferase